ncbi:MAG: 3-hydroxyacyl-ACP dehydratase FabZ family protein, partial [bacterium]
VMPGALLIEALAQAVTALIEVSRNFEKKALLVMVDQAKFRTLVKPGDQLHVEAKMLSHDENSAQMNGTIRLAERRVMTAKLTFAVKDASAFFTPAAKDLVRTMYDAWLRDAEISGIEIG